MFNFNTKIGPEQNTISVIIPAYNSATSLAHAIQSALFQKLMPSEVIVINDGSTDVTAEVAKSFENRIIYLEQENQGQGAARNAGLHIATGEFVAFLDADDYWMPGFLKCCLDFLATQQDAIAVSTGLLIKHGGRPDRYWPPKNDENDSHGVNPCVIENFFDFWSRHDHIRTGSNVIRMDVIRQAGFQRPDLRISQDLEYWGYLATFGKWGFVPEHLWVGNPTPLIAQNGLIDKYRQRRKLCPTVEQWQARIVPRLREEDWPGFKVVRGRVAANFALSQIKSGNDRAARDMIRKYGCEMPGNWSANVMKIGHAAGSPGWKMAIAMIRFREFLKARWLRTYKPVKTVGSE